MNDVYSTVYGYAFGTMYQPYMCVPHVLEMHGCIVHTSRVTLLTHVRVVCVWSVTCQRSVIPNYFPLTGDTSRETPS